MVRVCTSCYLHQLGEAARISATNHAHSSARPMEVLQELRYYFIRTQNNMGIHGTYTCMYNYTQQTITYSTITYTQLLYTLKALQHRQYYIHCQIQQTIIYVTDPSDLILYFFTHTTSTNYHTCFPIDFCTQMNIILSDQRKETYAPDDHSSSMKLT